MKRVAGFWIPDDDHNLVLDFLKGIFGGSLAVGLY